MSEGHLQPTREAWTALQAGPREAPLAMLNLLRFRERALYPAEHPAALLGRSGREAYAAYAAESRDILARVGGRQTWLGAAPLTLIGPAAEAWDLAFIAWYPNLAAFEAMGRDAGYRAALAHRTASLLDSRLLRCIEAPPGLGFGERATEVVSATDT